MGVKRPALIVKSIRIVEELLAAAITTTLAVASPITGARLARAANLLSLDQFFIFIVVLLGISAIFTYTERQT
jgi:hypothetical protein